MRVLDARGVEIGRGLARTDARTAASVAGPGKTGDAVVVVHRDDLVVW